MEQTTQANAGLQRVEREPLGDQVLTQIRDALFAGRFEPGQRLVLRDLAESLGISITPVRDALNKLVAGGVLEQGPRNSAVVPDLDAKSLRHLIIVRTELEGRATREAACNANPARLQTLASTMERMRQLIKARELEAYLDLHRQFHFGIYRMADIPILFEMIESLWLRCGPVLTFVIPDYVLSLKGTDHHLRILEALRAGDADTAEAEMIADIEEAGAYLLGLADQEGHIRRDSGPA
jgi:DNA-binding GntR family transcriptional regulator